MWIFFQNKANEYYYDMMYTRYSVSPSPDSPLDGDADRHEDAPRVRDRREGVKEELVQLGVDPAAREVEQHVERHQLDKRSIFIWSLNYLAAVVYINCR